MSDYEFWQLFEDPDKPEPGDIIWVDPPPLTPEEKAVIEAESEQIRLTFEKIDRERRELEARRTISYTVVYMVDGGCMGCPPEGPYTQEVMAASDADLKVVLKGRDWDFTYIQSAYRTDAKVI